MTAEAATLARLEVDAYQPAQEQMDFIIRELKSGRAQRMRHDEVEKKLEVEGRELLRRLLQAHLYERGPGLVEEEVVDAEGEAHRQQRQHLRPIRTIFGEVKVQREGYGKCGKKSLHPMDAELKLPAEKYSHELQRRIAEAAAKEPYDEIVKSITGQTGVRVPKRQA